MSTPNEDRAQIARVKWLLQLAVQATGILGCTQQVINQLAAAMVEVMTSEGFFLESQQAVDDQCAGMEADAT